MRGAPQIFGLDEFDGIGWIGVALFFIGVDQANGRVAQLAEGEVIAVAVLAIDFVLYAQVQFKIVVVAQEVGFASHFARDRCVVGPGGEDAQLTVIAIAVEVVHIADGVHVDHADHINVLVAHPGGKGFAALAIEFFRGEKHKHDGRPILRRA